MRQLTREILRYSGALTSTVLGGAVLKNAIETEAYLPAMGGAVLVLGGIATATINTIFPNPEINITNTAELAQRNMQTVEVQAEI